MSIRAIETVYAGHRFRSRLEARWAVFFDELGIEWQYEPEGYERDWNDGPIRYLPDFYLPATRTWVEVKGSDEQLSADLPRLITMCDWGSPIPGINESWDSTRGLLLLGQLPRIEAGRLPVHPILQHHKGVFVHAWQFYTRDLVRADGALGQMPVELGDEPWYDASCGHFQPIELDAALRYPSPQWAHLRPAVDNAYHAARQARFEHGQNGAR